MESRDTYEALVYQYHVLRARCDIKDHFANVISGEIYENILQVLNLVKNNLHIVAAECEPGTQEKLKESQSLIVKSIRDLREISQLLFLEHHIETRGELTDLIVLETIYRYPDADRSEMDYDPLEKINHDQGVVFFKLVLDLFALVEEIESSLFAVSLDFSASVLKVAILIGNGQACEEILQKAGSSISTIAERAEAITASVTVGKYKTHLASLALSMSIK